MEDCRLVAKKLFFFLNLCLPACLNVDHMHVLLREARRGRRSLWNCNNSCAAHTDLASISRGTSDQQCMGTIQNSQMSSEHPQDEAQPSNTYLMWLSVSIHSQLLLTQLSTAHGKH